MSILDVLNPDDHRSFDATTNVSPQNRSPQLHSSLQGAKTSQFYKYRTAVATDGSRGVRSQDPPAPTFGRVLEKHIQPLHAPSSHFPPPRAHGPLTSGTSAVRNPPASRFTRVHVESAPRSGLGRLIEPQPPTVPQHDTEPIPELGSYPPPYEGDAGEQSQAELRQSYDATSLAALTTSSRDTRDVGWSQRRFSYESQPQNSQSLLAPPNSYSRASDTTTSPAGGLRRGPACDYTAQYGRENRSQYDIISNHRQMPQTYPHRNAAAESYQPVLPQGYHPQALVQAHDYTGGQQDQYIATDSSWKPFQAGGDPGFELNAPPVSPPCTSPASETQSDSKLDYPQPAFDSRHHRRLSLKAGGTAGTRKASRQQVDPTRISPVTGLPTKILSKRCFPPKDADRRRFYCTYQGCSKSFGRPSARETHSRTHTGAKPFTCPVPTCGRNFSVFSNLKRHMIVHPGVDFRGIKVHDLQYLVWDAERIPPLFFEDSMALGHLETRRQGSEEHEQEEEDDMDAEYEYEDE
ncbi:hypothetical protein P7C70_g3226, partial [Phenoliferia sp. Uapishka_3]